MNKPYGFYGFFCLLAFVFNVAFATQTIAVLPSDGTLSRDEEELLTDKMREAALKVLPDDFTLLKQDVVIKRLGGMENYIKECSETSCIVSLGEKAQVDYVAQCRVGKIGDNLRITVELYKVRTGGLLGTFSDIAKDFYKLLPLIEKNVPDVFKKITTQKQETPVAPAAPVAPVVEEAPPPAKEETKVVVIEDKTSDLENAVDAMPGYKKPKKKIDPQVEPEKKSNKSFWVALALDIAGAGLIYYGYTMNEEAINRHNDYISMDNSITTRADFDKAESAAWKKVDEAKTSRNMSYILGSVFLTTGIGVHIWF